MKQLFILFAFLLLMQSLHAHKTDSTAVAKTDSFPRINEISWVFTEVIDGGLLLRYERRLGRNIALGISVGLKGEEGIIHLSGLDYEQLKTSDITYSGFKIVPEVRYYLDQTRRYQMDGFYFGIYTKFSQYNSDLFGTYFNDEGLEHRIDADARLNLLTIGLGIGYKLALGDRWNMDFMIAGPGATRHRYKFKNNLELPDEFYEDLIEALENYSFFDYIDSDFRFDVEDAKAKFIFPTFRYGITIAYTFAGKKNKKK